MNNYNICKQLNTSPETPRPTAALWGRAKAPGVLALLATVRGAWPIRAISSLQQ